jgi:hypothetical protein
MKKRVINFDDNRLCSGWESGDLSTPPRQEEAMKTSCPILPLILSSFGYYGKDIAIFEFMLQAHRLSREFGALSPDQSISE